MTPATLRRRLRRALHEAELFERRHTSRFRLLPDALVIGAQRCGTSSLYQYLIAHPSIPSAARKEVHFFDVGFARGLGWYRTNFALGAYRWWLERVRRTRCLVVEASPYYLYHPHVPARAAATLPRVRLIAILRNPVDRAVSHYYHEVRMGREPLPLDEALDREPERLRGEEERLEREAGYQSFSHRRHSYVARGIYVDQLRRWTAHFPREQLLVLRAEDLFADAGALMREVFDWLGLPPASNREYRPVNKARYPKTPEATRARLAGFFRPHNQRLYEFLGRDMGWDVHA